jgi:hypothetical protein
MRFATFVPSVFMVAHRDYVRTVSVRPIDVAHTEVSTGAELPRFIKDEFDAFLECGILAQGFLRLRCGECCHDKLLAFSCKRRIFGVSVTQAARGACHKPRRNWSTASSRTHRCGNGCFPLRLDASSVATASRAVTRSTSAFTRRQ